MEYKRRTESGGRIGPIYIVKLFTTPHIYLNSLRHITNILDYDKLLASKKTHAIRHTETSGANRSTINLNLARAPLSENMREKPDKKKKKPVHNPDTQ